MRLAQILHGVAFPSCGQRVGLLALVRILQMDGKLWSLVLEIVLGYTRDIIPVLVSNARLLVLASVYFPLQQPSEGAIHPGALSAGPLISQR